MKTSFMSRDELLLLGFKGLGQHVKISRKASFYNVDRIEIGDYSRVDDFCVLSAGPGGIRIGRYVHMAISSSLIGESPIWLKDFVNVSSRVAIYSSNDDYSGDWMTNPTVPNTLTNVYSAPVIIEEHVIVGCGSVILPGVTMGKVSGAGALSLIKTNCDAFGMYVGNPAKKVGERSGRCLGFESSLNDRKTTF